MHFRIVSGWRLVGWSGMMGGLATLARGAEVTAPFPRPLDSYGDQGGGLWEMLCGRAAAEPFNVAAAVIFGFAIVHTFLTAKFRRWAHEIEERHAAERPRLKRRTREGAAIPEEVSFRGQMLHFFGEVEVVFGLWVIPLLGAVAWFKGWPAVVSYLGHQVNFTEAMFVVVIMALASTRPVLLAAEQCLRAVARVGRCSVAAWWLSIVILAPVLGSLITEPAAMTIAALLLARQFYELKPSTRFGYATLGLLFVNVSVGGTFTHFAAPPVLMVAGPWGWGIGHMFTHFGWKALIGIVVASGLTFAVFGREFVALEAARTKHQAETKEEDGAREPVPAWITIVQFGFVALTVFVGHHPVLFIGGFLFFLAFTQATGHHQDRLDLRAPMLVGFFLAGLVVHGGLQGWWIGPVLSGLREVPLFLTATALTAVNDNAAITYLATLVPDFTDPLKYAIVAGAVTGGGLTVIANAPNPAGQAILGRYFPGGVAPLGLFLGALAPTVVMGAAFMLL